MTRTNTNQRREPTRTNAALVHSVGSCRLAGVNQRCEPTRTNAALPYGVGWHKTRTNEPTPPYRVALVVGSCARVGLPLVGKINSAN